MAGGSTTRSAWGSLTELFEIAMKTGGLDAMITFSIMSKELFEALLARIREAVAQWYIRL